MGCKIQQNLAGMLLQIGFKFIIQMFPLPATGI